MAGISFSQNGLTPLRQLLGHNKGILEKWISLEDCIYSSDTFSAELKEQVRRALAFHNGYEYCMAKRAPSENRIDSRVQSAIRAVDLSSSKTHISDDEINALKEVFADSEIAELLALICSITACQRFGALPGLEASYQIWVIDALSVGNPETQFVDGDPILLQIFPLSSCVNVEQNIQKLRSTLIGWLRLLYVFLPRDPPLRHLFGGRRNSHFSFSGRSEKNQYVPKLFHSVLFCCSARRRRTSHASSRS